MSITVSQLSQLQDRDSYGELRVSFEAAIRAAYPEIKITTSAPGCWGHSGNLGLQGTELVIPDGTYSSSKHFHSAGHGILGVESSRKKLNLGGCPLFLLTGYAYNGDYRSVKKTYWLFGRNEDASFFLHKIRPSIGQTADFEAVRTWLWSLKPRETVATRQGDLAFIPKQKPAAKLVPDTQIHLGNHQISASTIRSTGKRYYVLNPQALHGEHHPIVLSGWFELRLARVWLGGMAD